MPQAIEKIPEHLKPFIFEQGKINYSAIHHASWRYIMRVAKAFFKEHAHESYFGGLEKTGITTDTIPSIANMDQKMRQLGWRAVGVRGILPPNVFLEFQSLGVLPIATEMRKLENIGYTPTPDIVHEAAGHAPIIADPGYEQYLRNYATVSKNAIISDQDLAQYEAIRSLSVIKEHPKSTQEEIDAAQKRLDEVCAAMDWDSEATHMARLAWWTIEYGLVGPIEKPLIYGAGLLSSVGESYHCLSDQVKKIPLTMDCVNVGTDITQEQPQLFVTPNFDYLNTVLEEYANTMAFRRGGIEGLAKAKRAKTINTTVLDSGIQISGQLTEYRTNEKDEVFFLRYQGPVQLAYKDQEIENHGPQNHQEGFSTPIGPIKGLNKSTAELTDDELKSLGFKDGQRGKIDFSSGIVLQGELTGKVMRNGQNLILSFINCDIRLGDEQLYDASWGPFDLACGLNVPSVFGCPADRVAYYKVAPFDMPEMQLTDMTLSPEKARLSKLYETVRQVREEKPDNGLEQLESIDNQLRTDWPNEWLLRLELLELKPEFDLGEERNTQLKKELEELAKVSEVNQELISRGLALLSL